MVKKNLRPNVDYPMKNFAKVRNRKIVFSCFDGGVKEKLILMSVKKVRSITIGVRSITVGKSYQAQL